MQNARHRTQRQVVPLLRQAVAALAILMVILLLASVALAQGNYDLSWRVIAGGSRQMQSASYTMMGTVGQPLAGLMGNSRHSLGSSFWSGAAAEYRVYLPIVVRN
jgi:hypothetical protein